MKRKLDVFFHLTRKLQKKIDCGICTNLSFIVSLFVHQSVSAQNIVVYNLKHWPVPDTAEHRQWSQSETIPYLPCSYLAPDTLVQSTDSMFHSNHSPFKFVALRRLCPTAMITA